MNYSNWAQKHTDSQQITGSIHGDLDSDGMNTKAPVFWPKQTFETMYNRSNLIYKVNFKLQTIIISH